MKKTVTLDLELAYDDICQVSFTEDSVKFTTFVDHTSSSATLPIDVFYYMWNSDEMMSHMEAYHERRKSDNSSDTA